MSKQERQLSTKNFATSAVSAVHADDLRTDIFTTTKRDLPFPHVSGLKTDRFSTQMGAGRFTSIASQQI
jgi:hypothetical protein